jgi:hypothetical protein
MEYLRKQLVDAALAWEKAFCNAPAITSALSELDAAQLLGMTHEQYCAAVRDTTAVRKGTDFQFNGIRYQIKANRPSGKRGSFVTMVPKASNYEWDRLIWVLYDSKYEVQEAWEWEARAYEDAFHNLTRLSPDHYRRGRPLKISAA